MKERIQIATLCLFMSSLCLFALGWSIYGKGGAMQIMGVLICVYSVGTYVAMGFLAIDLKRWAWLASNGAFVIHMMASIIFAYGAIQGGLMEWMIFMVWVSVGAIGLWANLRPGSKAAIQQRHNAHP